MQWGGASLTVCERDEQLEVYDSVGNRILMDVKGLVSLVRYDVAG